MTTDELISPQYSAPRLWLERVVIFRTVDPVDPIREIPLQPGLNVIWGMAQEVEDESESPGILTGHSVGKTTLCRLIRYALGESTFGRKAAVKAIRQAFPGGAVGVTLHLDGARWSVVRPIGFADISQAAENLSIEELLAQPAETQSSYSRFQERLEQAFIALLPARTPPNSPLEYGWTHLLAWLSRDQEARYQNLWEWRSARSDSGVPAFKNRKEAALHLMRMVMGLIDGAEATLTGDLDQWTESLRAKEEQMREMQQEPEYRVRYQAELLCSLLGPGFQPGGESLFGLGTQVPACKISLQKEIAKLTLQRRSLALRLSTLRAKVQQHEQRLENIEAAFAPTQEGTEERSETDKELRELESVSGDDCIYGQIAFKECPPFLEYLKELRGEWIDLQRARQDKRADNTAEERQLLLRDWLEEKTHLKVQLQSARDTVAQWEKDDQDFERQIVALSTRVQQLEYHAAQWQDARDLLDGKKTDTKLERVRQDLEKLRQDIREGERQRKQLQERQWRQGIELRKLYDQVLKRVLSPSYSGEVLLPPRYDLEFRIQEASAGLTGEAVETLALVLADFTAMLWSIQGNGQHPAFLLHDSPREADLDRHIYNRFLRSIHDIALLMGGNGAPFQYIITTTSKPPKAIMDSDAIRLKLQAHPENDLLFRQFLNSQGSFFSFQSEKR